MSPRRLLTLSPCHGIKRLRKTFKAMVTIKDVARRAGVSIATVSHVINGTRKVSSKTASRVWQAVEELGYQPNGIAQSLRTRTTHAIGVVVSDITNPFFATLVRGAEDAALEVGYSLVVCNSDEDPEKEEMYIRLLWKRRMDGLLIAPARDGTSPALQELVRNKIPFVFIDRKAKGIEADVVLSDNVGGAYLATRHLIEKGHRRIGIILGIPGSTTTEERFAGYCQALEEAGLLLDKKLVNWGKYKLEGGRKACSELLSLEDPPTAIFSTNNQMTKGVLQELFARNISIPRIAVVSFDDFDLAELFIPPITVVTQNPYQIGYIAFQVLLERISRPDNKEFKEIRVPVELKIRGSA